MIKEANTSSTEFIMKPRVDFCFKELMKNSRARQGFVAALLDVRPEEIAQTTLMDPVLPRDYPDDKLGILDVHIQLQDGSQIDLEMQVASYKYWEKRVLFYLSKMYVTQLHEGDNYSKCGKCIHVSILNFSQFSDAAYCRKIHFRDDCTGDLYSNLLEIQVLELKKLPPELSEDGTPLENWMRFFRGEKKEDFAAMAEKDPYLKEAYDTLMHLSEDEEKRLAYEAREKAIRDYNSFMEGAREEGLEKGLAEGRAAGMAEGRAAGMAEGRAAGMAEGLAEGLARGAEIARRYYVEHETPAQIAAALGYEEETVKSSLNFV